MAGQPPAGGDAFDDENALSRSSAATPATLDLERDDLLLGWLSRDLRAPDRHSLAPSAFGHAAATRHAAAAKTNYYPAIAPPHLGRQRVSAGALHLERTDSNLNHSYVIGAERMYQIGSLRGGFLRRGVLWGDEAGVWCQPFKVLDGLLIELQVDDHAPRLLNDCRDVTNRLHAMEFVFHEAGVQVVRRDFSPDAEYAFFYLVDLTNTHASPRRVRLKVTLQANLRPIWHRPWIHAYGPDEIALEPDGVFVARDPQIEHLVIAFGVAGAARRTIDSRNPYRHRGESAFEFTLAPGETRSLEAGVAVHDRRKAPLAPLAAQSPDAASYLRSLLPRAREFLADQERHVAGAVFAGPQFTCPDQKLVDAFLAAKYNLDALRADLRPYLQAPHLMTCPERAYQHLFGIDPLYASAGATLAGFAPAVRSTLDNHFFYAGQTGMQAIHFFVDHFGRHGERGSRAQETTQFIATVWEHLKLTGDREYATAVYPKLQSLLAGQEARDRNGDGWIEGMTFPSLTRKAGSDTMGCAAVRLCWALRSLAELAATLGDAAGATRFQARAAGMQNRYRQEWWSEQAGGWATALEPTAQGGFDQIVLRPFRYGSANYPQTYRVADFARGVQATHRIWADAVDADGGFHGPAVTPWQNGNMALAAYRYGLPEYGFRLLSRIADNPTRLDKMLGAFSTINSPVDRSASNDNKLMYVWGVGPFLEAVITGLLGIEANAFDHTIRFCPQLPREWPHAALRGFRFGGHSVDFVYAASRWQIRHASGPAPLRIVTGPDAAPLVIPAGTSAELHPPAFWFSS